MSRRYRILLFCLLSLVFIGCDRLTKDLARHQLMNRETISYWHDTFRLTYVENTGAALSLGDHWSRTASFWLLSILPLVFLLSLFGYACRRAGQLDIWKLFCLALIFSGGLGNILDRLFFDRHVPDFMNLGICTLRTGIFNFADVCVTGGVAGLLFASLLAKKRD